nr:hypothetical protein [Tanacetum cinerariifolium]
ASKAVDEVVTNAVGWAMQAPLWNRFRDLPEADIKESFWILTSATTTSSTSIHQLRRLGPSISLTPSDLQMDDDMAPDEQARFFDDEDIRNAHIPKVNLRQDWWKPLEEERPATLEHACSIPSSDVPYQMEEFHKLLTDSVDNLIVRHNVSKPLPLGGPPGQVTIQSDFFFNKDLEYLRYGSKDSRPALSILKMKAAYYPDVCLEQMVPDQMWIEKECKCYIAAMYGFEYKHDYMIIDSPRPITFHDRYEI